MKLSKSAIIAIGAAIVATGVGMSTSANAACVNSHWQKTSGTSLAGTILGRQCGPNMSVRLQGIVDTGWIAMNAFGNVFTATFVDNAVTTKINMNTNGGNMNVTFKHIDNGGAVSITQGNYKLVSLK